VGRACTMQSDFATQPNRPRGTSREVESLLWLAAGAAWALVALRAWAQTKRVEARRRTFNVSDKLLGQVFPDGIKQ
jgi:hypothetical protein